MPSSSDRFHTVHFRTAMNALNRVLRDWTSFVLLENHSYIRFLERYCGSKPWAERCFKYLSHIYFQSRIALFTFTFFNCIVLYSIVFVWTILFKSQEDWTYCLVYALLTLIVFRE